MARSIKKGHKDIENAGDSTNVPLDTHFSAIGSGKSPLMPIMQNQSDDLKIENPSDLRK